MDRKYSLEEWNINNIFQILWTKKVTIVKYFVEIYGLLDSNFHYKLLIMYSFSSILIYTLFI
jgi:hypothetical protein